MRMKIAICDDDELFATELLLMIRNYLVNKRIQADVSLFLSGKNLIYEIEEGKVFDLILTDIEMPETNGMDIIPIIKEKHTETIFILITDHIKYAIDYLS